MSESKHQTGRSDVQAPGTPSRKKPGGGVETRIDAAHEAPQVEHPSPEGDEKASPGNLLSPEGSTLGALMRSQADQLASHLRARQRELDHREAQLNARAAQLDNDTRAARLWFAERQAEWNERCVALQKEEETLRGRLDRLAVAETALEGKQQLFDVELRRREEAAARRGEEMDARAEQLRARELACKTAFDNLRAEQARSTRATEHQRQQLHAETEASRQSIQRMLAGLEKRREQVETRLALRRRDAEAEISRRRKEAEADARRREEQTARPGAALLARETEVRKAGEELHLRARQLEEAEARLDTARREQAKLQEALNHDRGQLDEEVHAQRRRLIAERQQMLDEIREKQKALERRSEHVDHCAAALEELRSKLGQLHRETLEMRLATEELWAELSGAAPPATLTRSLGKIRARLAEEYRLADAELAEQKKELELLRRELGAQHETLAKQKRRFDAWLEARQAEIEKRAARLVAREQELHRQETTFQQQSRKWRQERMQHEDEIRRLRARLGAGTAAESVR